MPTACLLKRILPGGDAKIAISILVAWQQCNGTGRENNAPHVTACTYQRRYDDVEEFDSDDGLMHGDNEL